MRTTPWRTEEVRQIASIGTGAKDTQDRVSSGRYPFFVRSQKVERIDSWSFDGEAVLTAGDGVGTGKVFHYINGRFDCHQRVYRISNFRTDVSGRYFFHQFSQNFLARIESLTAKSSVDSVRMETIAGMPIPLPSRPEQEQIANAIDAVIALIEAIERKIAKMEAIKSGMMQQLLTGRTRLPGFRGDWTAIRLGSVAKMGSGGTPSSSVSQFYGGGIPWVSITDMTTGGKYIRTTASTLTKEGLAASAAKVYEPDVVLYAMYASVGECSLAVGRVSSSQAILGISTGPRLDREFLYYHLQFVKSRVKLLGQQGTQSNLNAGMVRNFEILLPDLREQGAIARVLRDADDQITACTSRLRKVRAIKSGMMQQLLTGRTRLPATGAP